MTKKKKRKQSSPFRIKVGCLVAIRFRPRENQIQLKGPDGKLLKWGTMGGEKEKDLNGGGYNNEYQEPVVSAQFSEVWTDPLPGHDDGLALIGSRIRCFFPKTVLSEPYNATSRRLEGEIVDVVNYCDEYFSKRRLSLGKERTSMGILVDLLIDNKDNRLLIAMPFLQRVDSVLDKEQLSAMSGIERRSYMNEERIKGGSDKAIVRVLLNDEISSGMTFNQRALSKEKQGLLQTPQALWVIRKRVPAKLVRQVEKLDNSDKDSKEEKNNNNMTKRAKDEDRTDSNEGVEGTASIDNDSLVGKKNGQQSDEMEIKVEVQSSLVESNEKPRRKKRKGMTTNKDFSSARYLGDGNDTLEQQEANWRWRAAKYNPYSVLADRPLSKGLLERLSYNFVGEVIRIQPETSPGATTLATVTIRCVVLPEHTLVGRLSHHGPYDAFDCMDLTLESIETEKTSSITTSSTPDTDKNIAQHKTATRVQSRVCLMKVPIEDLVIVRRKILRTIMNHADTTILSSPPVPPEVLTIRYSYSFHNDTYYPLIDMKDTREGENADDMEETKRCQRCHRESSASKSVTRLPHFLCNFCVESLRTVGFQRGGEQNEKSVIVCDCEQCEIKDESRLLSNLSQEVMKSISKLGGTLQELDDYSAQEDSGFITTRFVAKGMMPVSFAYNPLSVEASFASSSSKLISKITPRAQTKYKNKKKMTKLNVTVSSLSNVLNNNNKNRNGRKSPVRPYDGMKELAASNLISAPKKEVFRPTSARTLTYDARHRRFDAPATELFQWKFSHHSSFSHEYPELPRNLREEAEFHTDDQQSDNASGLKKSLGRTSRANQRRLVRSVAAMGVNVDTLAGREQQLRFDRSGIHDWGVFVDVDVREGDMIVEYRGEVIGNAMAEKREQEYHEAKLGSDYMFRIDELVRPVVQNRNCFLRCFVS
jgi:hypothetical protein